MPLSACRATDPPLSHESVDSRGARDMRGVAAWTDGHNRMNLKAQRIYEARREGLLMRLAEEERLGIERAEELIAGREAEALSRAIDRSRDDFWKLGGQWVYGERNRPR